MNGKEKENSNFKGKGKPRKPRIYGPRQGGATRTSNLSGESFHSGEERFTKSTNDVAWYAHNPQILKDAASLSFNTPNGLVFPTYSGTYSEFIDPSSVAPAGICAVGYTPIPGTTGLSGQNIDATNIAAQSLYGFIRHANSGSKVYERSDLMMYIISMQSIYMRYLHLRRALYSLRVVSMRNRYLPRALITSMGLSYESMVGNEANLRAQMNTIAAQINSLAVPNTLNWFKRTAFLAQNIYADSDDVSKASLYVFVPTGYYTWDATTYETGSACKFHEWDPRYAHPFQDELNALRADIQAMLSNEDIGIMSGDIIKAYGDKLFMLPAVEDNVSVLPIYDEMVLSQIENSDSFGTYSSRHYWINEAETTTKTWDIVQNNNNIVFNPSTYVLPGDNTDYVIMNSRFKNVEPGDVMEMSRFKHAASYRNTYYEQRLGVHLTAADLISASTEVVTGYYIYYYRAGTAVENNVPQLVCAEISRSIVYQADVTDGLAATETLSDGSVIQSVISNLDWHPQFRQVWEISTVAGYTPTHGFVSHAFLDLDNYVVIENGSDVITRLNNTATLSLMNVPEIGTL